MQGINTGEFDKPSIAMRFGSGIHRLIAHGIVHKFPKVRARTERLVNRGFNEWAKFNDWDKPKVDWENLLHPREAEILEMDPGLSAMRQEQAREVARETLRFLFRDPEFKVSAVEVPMVTEEEFSFYTVTPMKGKTPVLEEFVSPVTCTPDILGQVKGEKALIDIKTSSTPGASSPALWRDAQLQSIQAAIQLIKAKELGAKAYHLVVPLSSYALEGRPYFQELSAPKVIQQLRKGLAAPYKAPRYSCLKCENHMECWGKSDA